MLSNARRILIPLLLLGFSVASAQEADVNSVEKSGSHPTVVHPKIGNVWSGGGLQVTFLTRKQQYSSSETETLDKDIHSPKSVNFHPSGRKYYVNSLEGGKTVVYDFPQSPIPNPQSPIPNPQIPNLYILFIKNYNLFKYKIY